MYADLPCILVKLEPGGIAVVALNRPEQRNAFNAEMKDSLVECFARLDKDDAVRVIVLTATPNAQNIFCAGADLGGDANFSKSSNVGSSSKVAGQRYANDHRDGGGQTSMAIMNVQKPTICAITGAAVGIGITMTLGCDIRVAWNDAKIGFVFAQRGIVPEAASSWLLPKLIGHSRALELFMTARVIKASSHSLDLLFSSLHPTPEATLAAAMAIAHEISGTGAALSHALTKGLVWHGEASIEDHHRLDSRAMAVSGNTTDSAEGVKAFKEKRKVRFTATVPKDLRQIAEIYPWWTSKL